MRAFRKNRFPRGKGTRLLRVLVGSGRKLGRTAGHTTRDKRGHAAGNSHTRLPVLTAVVLLRLASMNLAVPAAIQVAANCGGGTRCSCCFWDLASWPGAFAPGWLKILSTDVHNNAICVVLQHNNSQRVCKRCVGTASKVVEMIVRPATRAFLPT
ncbi:hypothetical protein VTI28DRAFT_10504 [Corynascus sepedonium]